MKILMIIDRYVPIWGGAENQLRQLIPHLTGNGCEVMVVTRRWKKEMACEDLIDRVPVRRLGWPGDDIVATLSYTLHLFFFLLTKGKAYDCIHSHGAVALGALGSLAAAIIRKRSIVKVATAGRISKMSKRYFGQLILHLFKSADVVICLSEEIHNELKTIGIQSDKVTKLGNAVDGMRFHPFSESEKEAWRVRKGFKGKDAIVLFSGRLVYRKGLDVLIGAWPRVVSAHPEAYLVIVGDGINQVDSIEEQMRFRVQHEGVKNVLFEGGTTALESYLGAADIFVFPSRKEGMPNAVLEAMAAGRAIIATDIGGVNDLIINGKTGILVPVENETLLADTLVKVLESTQLRTQLGTAAREHVLKNHSFAEVASRHKELYRSGVKKQS